MASTTTDRDRIDAMFDQYRPTATDADRRSTVDRIIDAIRDAFATSDREPTADDLELSRALDDLQATPPEDGSFDRQVQDVRARYRRHAGTW